eukprot:762029-Hanusia_phi.AAC.3
MIFLWFPSCLQSSEILFIAKFLCLFDFKDDWTTSNSAGNMLSLTIRVQSEDQIIYYPPLTLELLPPLLLEILLLPTYRSAPAQQQQPGGQAFRRAEKDLKLPGIPSSHHNFYVSVLPGAAG